MAIRTHFARSHPATRTDTPGVQHFESQVQCWNTIRVESHAVCWSIGQSDAVQLRPTSTHTLSL
jgi:hypothetical protein